MQPQEKTQNQYSKIPSSLVDYQGIITITLMILEFCINCLYTKCHLLLNDGAKSKSHTSRKKQIT